jgi:hypothetical protein
MNRHIIKETHPVQKIIQLFLPYGVASDSDTEEYSIYEPEEPEQLEEPEELEELEEPEVTVTTLKALPIFPAASVAV